MNEELKEQIARLREAIEKDEAEKIKAEAHADKLVALQRLETKLKARLAQVQKDIVAAIQVTFDVSDDMSIAAAKETLTKLENKLKENEIF